MSKVMGVLIHDLRHLGNRMLRLQLFECGNTCSVGHLLGSRAERGVGGGLWLSWRSGCQHRRPAFTSGGCRCPCRWGWTSLAPMETPGLLTPFITSAPTAWMSTWPPSGLWAWSFRIMMREYGFSSFPERAVSVSPARPRVELVGIGCCGG